MWPSEIWSWEAAFLAANTVCLWGWLILLFAPRTPVWINIAKFVIPIAVSLAYTVTLAVNIPNIEGGYMTLDGVRQLASTDAVLVAGWMHVVAFDLFVGAWAAERMDESRLDRIWQAPILIAIFLAGPFGFLIALAVWANLSRRTAA